jgi:putative transposase
MPRTARQTPAGFVYHVLNRATARLTLFRKPADYDAFLRILDEALQRFPTRLLAYCLMPTHWHFVLWPQRDGQMSQLLRWLTLTHAVRWQAHYHRTGSGHLYQNRFKAFAIEEDEHLVAVLRYVERNPLRAGLVERAERWAWSSLADRLAGGEAAAWLDPGPVPLPDDWVRRVNRPQTAAELAALRCSVVRGRPYGSEGWVEAVVRELGLQATVRPRGRPRKRPAQIPTEAAHAAESQREK